MHAGEYDITMHYTCARANVGSTVKLSCGDSKVSTKITVAHEPPIRGAAEDRSVRMESYVKDFRPMSLGRIKLKAGKQTLTLQATEHSLATRSVSSAC